MSFSKNILEKEFMTFLEKIIPKEKWLKVFRDSIIDLWKDRGKQSEIDIKRNEQYISILEAKKKRVFEMREDGSYSKEEFQQRKSEIEEEIGACKIALHGHRIAEFNIEKVLIYSTDFIRYLAQKWLIMQIEQKARFQNLVLPEGIPFIRNQGFGTAKLGYIFELIQTFGASKSSLVDLAEFSWNRFTQELKKWRKLIRRYERSCSKNEQVVSEIEESISYREAA